VEAVSRLVEDRSLRARLGREARKDVETKYTVEHWNRNLKNVFDQALGGLPPADRPVADSKTSAISGR
jgi:glycosyltransferase involved in cell wall biosynthesis